MIKILIEKDQKWLKDLLQKSNEDFKDIDILDISQGPEGAGILSSTLQAEVQINDETKKLFIKKSLPPDNPFQAFTYNYNMDICEDRAYTVIIPKLIDFEIANLGKSIIRDLLPKFYASNFISTENSRTFHLVLEDLSDDFQMEDVNRGLDMDQLTLVLSKMAHFHAVSFAYSHKLGIDFHQEENFDVIKFMQNPESLQNLEENYPLLIQDMKAANVDQENIDKIKRLSENYMKTYEKAFKGQVDGRFLGHGDLWGNNIMFRKYDPKDVKFIDWQCLNGWDPSLDFCRLTYTNGDPDTINDWLPDLHSTYYENLTVSLAAFGLETPFSLEQFVSKCNRGAFPLFCGFMFFYNPSGRTPVMNKRFLWMINKAVQYSFDMF
jgi:hypothetical protein